MQHEDLALVLNQSRIWNDEHSLTGMLVYIEGIFSTHIEGRFMQVLEGSKFEVQKIFNKIKCDPRHKEVVLLKQDCIRERNFHSWQMGFEYINLELYRDIRGFFQLDESILKSKAFQDSNAALEFLQSFYGASKESE